MEKKKRTITRVLVPMAFVNSILGFALGSVCTSVHFLKGQTCHGNKTLKVHMSLHMYKQLLMNLKHGWNKSFAGFACKSTCE